MKDEKSENPSISLTWYLSDVMYTASTDMRTYLNEDQARIVMKNVERKHKEEVDKTWAIFESEIYEVLEKEK